jgi:peptide/nickel transport system substrate-binding protein
LLKARSGGADVTFGLSFQAAHSLGGNSCCRLIANETPNTLEINMPPKGGPNNGNAQFREALTYAVPYDQILQRVAYGFGRLFYGPYPPIMPQYDATSEAPRPYDLARARQLIVASGVHTPVNMTMMINGAIPLDEQLATIVQGGWAQIGVRLKISKLPEATYVTKLNNRQYELAIAEDGPGVIDAGYYLGYDMLCGQSFNLGGICIPAADKLLGEARTTPDAAQQLATYRAIIPLWTADSPRIDVLALDAVTVLGPRVHHFFFSHEMDMRTWN